MHQAVLCRNFDAARDNLSAASVLHPHGEAEFELLHDGHFTKPTDAGHCTYVSLDRCALGFNTTYQPTRKGIQRTGPISRCQDLFDKTCHY